MDKLKIIAILMLTCLIRLTAVAQYQEDANTYSPADSLEITHCKEIRLTPGFWAQAGAKVHVYIDSTLICFEPDAGDLVQETNLSGMSNYNYVHTVQMREPELDVANLSNKERIETMNYFDGLGRPSQNIIIQGSPSNFDVIQPVDYDEFGREKLKYLPYVSGTNTGGFAVDAIADSKSFYSNEIPGHESDNIPFAEVLFDGSPLNRVTGEMGVGQNFHSFPTEVKYLTNTSSLKNWSVSGNPASYSSNDFAASELYLTEFIDENGNKIREYKDKLGRVVCKAAHDGSNWLDTHYLYDEFGLLRCIMPPKASDPNDTELCYYYTYDHRKRMIEKDLPGADPVLMVYDARDRLVMVLDGNNSKPNKPRNEWIFTEYDQLNRPVRTGIVKTNHKIDKIRNNLGNAELFPNKRYRASDIFTETYYDSYDPDIITDNYQFEIYNNTGLSVEKSNNTKGFVTGGITRAVKNADDDIPKTSLLSVMYYDRYGRPSRIISDNHLGGIDVVDNLYNFAGEITETLLRHNAQTGGNLISTLTTFEYDHQGRLITEKMKVNDQPTVILAAFDYNELGEQIAKYLHGNESTALYNQKVDYNYNIKGWLSNINKGSLQEENDLFAMELQYASLQNNGGLSAPLNYNGNISLMKWETQGADLPKAYGFTYDNLNRLKAANYADGSGLNSNTGAFKTAYAYDANGNLDTLQRYMDGSQIDQLVYQYSNGGNQILTVADQSLNNLGYEASTGQYTYDDNGNLLTDPGKDTNTEYNHLNLPRKVTFSNNDNIRYIYNSNGAKLRKAIADELGNLSKHIDYSGPFLYENDTLKTIFTSAGRIVPKDNNGEVLYKFEYNLQDHLGNTRVVFSGNDNGKPELLQLTDYYPFGMTMKQENYFNNDVLANNFLYNGKELQNDEVAGSKLDWYDYGRRFYDPQLGRWHSVDPMYARHYDWSPYAYVLGNPILKIDLYGLTDWNAVWQGTAAFAGGLASTVGGVGAALTPTGVGQIGGAFLISTGVPAMGLGIVKIATGIMDNGSAKDVPLGIGETLGMGADKVVGNENGELRNVGAVTDIGTNLVVGGVPKTAIEVLATGSQTIGTASDVLNTNSGTGSQTTENATTSSGSQVTNNENTTAARDNTTIVNTPVKDITGNNQVTQKALDEYFGQ